MTEYEVLAVRYGTRTTSRREVFLHFELYGEPDEQIAMDYYFWVIRAADGPFLVDCGFNARSGALRNRIMLTPPLCALRQLSIEPADVRKIIVTHGHYDHIGNLRAFPTAEVVMSEREYRFWTGSMADKPPFAVLAEADDIDALREAEAQGRLTLVGKKYQLADGVTLEEVGGHTPGQLIVVVRVAAGEVVLASDSLHYYEEMELDRPFLHVADLPGMYTGYARLRELGATRQIVAGHDPKVLADFVAVGRDIVRIGG